MSDLQLWGAGAFGLLIGWYVYYINRHRREEVSATDLVSLLGVIGGAAILKLFPAQTDLFGAYGLGLAVGFFSYFVVMFLLVLFSKNFDADYFLDGRRKRPVEPFYIPTREEQASGVDAGMSNPTPEPGGEPRTPTKMPTV
jgi:hypothetical protein